jgi:hypothetical protein
MWCARKGKCAVGLMGRGDEHHLSTLRLLASVRAAAMPRRMIGHSVCVGAVGGGTHAVSLGVGRVCRPSGGHSSLACCDRVRGARARQAGKGAAGGLQPCCDHATTRGAPQHCWLITASAVHHRAHATVTCVGCKAHPARRRTRMPRTATPRARGLDATGDFMPTATGH